MKKMAVHLVTWNGEKYISHLFASLKQQTYQDFTLYIWDNHSQKDQIVRAMKKELEDVSFSYELIEHTENIGFAGGHNALYAKTKSEYMLLLNQDMYLEKDCFEKMVQFLDTHEDVAVVSPRLMRWDYAFYEKTGDLKESCTDDIDSIGLKVFRNRRVVEKYTGKKWSDVKHKMHQSFRSERFRGSTALEVFGVSGAFPLFRRSAIDDVAFDDGTFLDEIYHSYKEDVDLAFRLRSAGYRAYTLLDTVAYHDRTGVGAEEQTDMAAAKNKKKQPDWVKYHSYKNHLMTLYKNEYGINFFLDGIFIKWYESKKFLYFLLFDRAVLKGLKELWAHRIILRARRKQIKSKRIVNWKQLRTWWI